MGKVTTKTLKVLRKRKLSEKDREYIPIAGDLLGKASQKGYVSGFPDVDGESISKEEGKMIESAVISALQRHRDPKVVAALIWALGKSNSRSLEKTLRSCLQQHLQSLLAHNAVVSQALIALNNIGELKTGPSWNISRVEANIKRARAYLNKFGILVPW